MNKIFIVLIFLIAMPVHSQLKTDWSRRFNAPNGPRYIDEYASSVKTDEAGNIYVFGSSDYISHSGSLVVKYDQNGEVIWYSVNPQSRDFQPFGFSLDHLHNIYVTGASSYGITTMKFDSLGNFNWERTYNILNPYFEYGTNVSNDESGNVFVLGFSEGVSQGGYIVIKYDPAGNTEWVRKYFNDYGGMSSAMAVDKSGNIYVTGYMSFLNNDDFLTIKYNTQGDSLWVRRYNVTGSYEHATAIAVDTSGNVFVTGNGGGSPFVYWLYKYLTVKYDSSGNQMWYRKYDGLGNIDNDLANSICTDKAGNVYVTGKSSYQTNNSDYATIKYNTDGDSLWVKRYNGPGNGNDEAISICLDKDGNVFVTGTSYSPSSFKDFATIKYSNSGTQLWAARYDGPTGGNDYSASVASDLSGNVYVTGLSPGAGSGYDFLTIKYSSTFTDIKSVSLNTEKDFALFQNYPNPFNPNTDINFSIANTSIVKLAVYDIQGKLIETIVNGQLTPGTYKAEWNGSGFSSGIYIYRLVVSSSNSLEAGNFVSSKRMMLVK